MLVAIKCVLNRALTGPHALTILAAELVLWPLNPPRRFRSRQLGKHDGNLDNREVVAGSTLYIPV